VIRIGPAGWTHPGLSAIWPARRAQSFDPLAFLGTYFGCIEVDVTAHVTPRQEHVVRWSSALADHPRTRLLVRLPTELVDLARPAAKRDEAAERFREALSPLVRRQRLGAVVAVLAGETLFGPAETRAMAALARALGPVPLVLEAAHPSWHESRALDAVGGAGWSLAHLELDETWNAPPRRHRPTGPIGMLRLVRAGVAEPARIAALARRARAIASDVDTVFVVTDNGGRAGTPAGASLAAALEIKFVLGGERPVPAWRGIIDAFPHLAPLVELESEGSPSDPQA